jgi:aldehyde dehydrogenase (NAD+)
LDTIARYAMFIGWAWVDADERFEIRSPATEELVASVAKGGRLDRRAYPPLLSTPPG